MPARLQSFTESISNWNGSHANGSESVRLFILKETRKVKYRAAFDMESILTHEMGHALGFSHSAVWSAMMFPFAPTVGTFSGIRPSQGQPDAPLGEDDRTGLRVLYPDPSDTLHVGAIRGHILNANPLSLPASPRGVTGVFGSHVVAVDAATGAGVGV